MKNVASPIMMSPQATPAKTEFKLPSFSLPAFKPAALPPVVASTSVKSPDSKQVLLSPMETVKLPSFAGLPPISSPSVLPPVASITSSTTSVIPPLPVSSKPVVFTIPPSIPTLPSVAPQSQIIEIQTQNTEVQTEITSGIPETSQNPKFPTVVSPKAVEIKELIPTLKVASPLPAFTTIIPTSPITPTVPQSIKLPSTQVKSPSVTISLPPQGQTISSLPVVLLPSISSTKTEETQQQKQQTSTNLQIAQEGAKDAEFVNKQANFQKATTIVNTLPSLGGIPVPMMASPLPSLSIPAVSQAIIPNTSTFSLPPITNVPLPVASPIAPQITKIEKGKEEKEKGKEEVLSFKPSIVSLANLPSPSSRDKNKDPSPKIKIPKVKGVAVKKVKKTDTFVAPLGGSIALPTGSTIVPEIPISPPSQMIPVKTTVKAVADASQVMENIKDIDLSRLTEERVNKKSGVTPYSIAELKTIAASLNLAKTGNKKDLVDRIKSYILKYNPSAFD